MTFRERNLILIGGKDSGSEGIFLHNQRKPVWSIYYKDMLGLAEDLRLCVSGQLVAGMNSLGTQMGLDN